MHQTLATAQQVAAGVAALAVQQLQAADLLLVVLLGLRVVVLAAAIRLAGL
jgi:hypothetical protein